MIILHKKTDLQSYLARRQEKGKKTGFVPTMGALHQGHVSLIESSRKDNSITVCSIFINPTQFNDANDFKKYPVTIDRDIYKLEAAGCDVLFLPPVDEIYPDGFATTVRVKGLGEILEGAERGPGHFEGVCTVVAKLFNIVGPDVAFFGQKDAQQVAVLRRMTADLDIPVRIEVVPTVREPDGLALSSRNVRLDPSERERALALSQALAAARETIGAGERDSARIRESALAAMAPHQVAPEYLALVDPDSFLRVDAVNGRVLVAVAARVGDTRLIDNALVATSPAEASTPNKER